MRWEDVERFSTKAPKMTKKEQLEARKALSDKIEGRKKSSLRWARIESHVANGLAWLSIASSAVIASAVAFQAAPAWMNSLIIAAYGIPAAAERYFSFARRSQWHWDLANSLDRLNSALIFESADIAEVARGYSRLIDMMEPLFPRVRVPNIDMTKTDVEQKSLDSARKTTKNKSRSGK